jgi:acyl-CoA thioester hydrolase
MQQLEHSHTGFRHTITVRYGECDMQGVVFNANYLAYVDDVCDRWLTSSLGPDWNRQFDAMVKKASLEWHSASRHGDALEFALQPTRWGNSSFDVRVAASVGGRPVVTVDVTYISVAPGSHAPLPIPAGIRRALGGATQEPELQGEVG